MTHPIVIQTTEMMEYRMMEQLRRWKVDSSLYVLGGEWTAQAFKKWDEESPPPWDITHGPSQNHYGGERCVVDLGPGSGQPCLAATKVILDHIHEIVLVDVSPEMLSMAQDYLHRNTQAAITCIIADFLQDAAALDAVLKGFPRPRLFLCLGRTVGNFDQCYVLRTLQSYLREDDYLLLDVGLYPPKHTEDFLKDLANRYMGAINLLFGLHFLAACDAEPASRYTSASVGEDDEDPATQIIRVFYRFPKNTVLTVGKEKVVFKEGERLQIIESRWFLADTIEHHLKKYGLGVVTSQHFEKNEMLRGVFLCRRV
jgi:uncharacterized SAM-dependent methyltransferase